MQADKQPIQSAEGHAKLISDLTREAATIARIQSEVDKLLRKKAKTDILLKKAKSNPGFPATIDHYEQANEDEKNELRRLNDDKRQHESRHYQLEKALKSSLDSALSHDPSKLEERILRLEKNYEEKVTRLQNEWEEKLAKYQNQAEGKIATLEIDVGKAKAAAADAEKRATQAANTSQTLAGAVGGVQDQIRQLQKSRANQSTPERNAASISASNQLREEINNLDKRITKLGSDIQPLVSFKGHCLEMFDGLNRASVENAEDMKTKTVEPLRRKIEDISSRLDSLSSLKTGLNNIRPETNTSPEIRAMVESLKRQLQNLEEDHVAKLNNVSESLGQIQGLQELHSGMVDEEFVNVKKRLDEQAEEFKLLKEGYSHASDDLKKLGDANSTVTQSVTGLSATIENAQRVLETVRTGLHSLEVRWNNLSTEHIVRNMAAAMQEMYPSAEKFQEQLATLKANTANTLHTINEQTSRLAHTQANQEQRLLQISGQVNGFGNVVPTVNHLAESFKALRDNVQQPIQDLAQLQANLGALEKQLDGHTAKLGELGANSKTHAESLHKLEQEREALDSELKEIMRQGRDLATQLRMAVDGNVENAEEVKAHTTKLKEFGDRVADVEASAAARDASFGSRMQLLEESTARKAEALREELGRMMSSAEPRQSSLQHDDPRLRAPAQSEQQGESTTDPAIPPKKKKKKRPRPSMEDDKGSLQDSPATQSADGTAIGEHGERRKKKKKKIKTQEEAPVQ